MDDVDEFFVLIVIVWFMYIRESLRRLNYNVRISSNFNIFDICGRYKFEMLVLVYNIIIGVEFNY